jgi:hypothetical protein
LLCGAVFVLETGNTCTKYWWQNFKRRGYFEYADFDGKIILKWALQKYGMIPRNPFDWLTYHQLGI